MKSFFWDEKIFGPVDAATKAAHPVPLHNEGFEKYFLKIKGDSKNKIRT